MGDDRSVCFRVGFGVGPPVYCFCAFPYELGYPLLLCPLSFALQFGAYYPQVDWLVEFCCVKARGRRAC
eukprot:3192586-Rhodomonas_salina.1